MKWVTSLYQRMFWRRAFWVLVTLASGFAFFWSLIRIAGLPAKRVATFTFVIVWVFHLVVGIGAMYAEYRIWPERRNKFVEYTSIHLNAAITDAIVAFVLIFMSQNVRFTWKFSLTMFAGAFLRDVFRVPLIFYAIRGPSAEDGEDVAIGMRLAAERKALGREIVTDAIRETVKPEYLK